MLVLHLVSRDEVDDNSSVGGCCNWSARATRQEELRWKEKRKMRCSIDHRLIYSKESDMELLGKSVAAESY
ncbi:hypothetical protein Pmani_019536 [Petrolisthes manimaculis]|uniref:Uncharacterized protein n=1 Tax=Petrolisthes manimaculis TaxID=1843537 RepID=A0AAE1U7J3_9EUCA|nr:hypothetical protein Pmani_019536 [Petrolisthes manimaculis]